VQQAAGDAPEHRGAEAAPPVRPDDDQVGVDLARRLRDQLGDVMRPVDHLEVGRQAELAQLGDLALDLLHEVGLVAQHRCTAEAAGEQLVRMHGDDLRVMLPGDIHHGHERAVCELRSVGRPDDGLEHDMSFPGVRDHDPAAPPAAHQARYRATPPGTTDYIGEG
jgi:hypothetical protein